MPIFLGDPIPKSQERELSSHDRRHRTNHRDAHYISSVILSAFDTNKGVAKSQTLTILRHPFPLPASNVRLTSKK